MHHMLRGAVMITVLCATLSTGCGRSDMASNETQEDKSSLSPLSMAAKRGDVSVVRKLLTARADPNGPDSEGNTPLHYAVSSGKIAVVETLLAGGANVRACSRSGYTALHAVAVDRQVRIAELLLAAGADINARTDDNVTPLLASVGSPYSDSKMSLTLIRAGADVNIADSDGRTALWLCSQVCEELLKRGADPNIKARALGFPGYTPLHMAAMNGYTEKVKLLLQSGADPSIRNDTGETPLDITNVKFAEVRELLTHSIKGKY
ncbi:MAG TPA: ankyrin repeat domain-containing protein [Chthoniobacterales bacterium]|nr:ankyrin repeat domain-containing protein [Chthoniobacterales bacterium]